MRQLRLWLGLALIVMVITSLWLRSETSFDPKTDTISADPGVMTLKLPEQAELGNQFGVTVEIDTKNRAINAVGLRMEFDPKLVKVTQMDTSQSFCTFYPQNKYDNQTGQIIIECGTPNPGFKGVNQLVKIKFVANQIGVAKFKVLPQSQILLNDGHGTDILRQYPEAQVLIVGDRL